MKTRKIGFTIGKFAPLHKGHEALIEQALSEMDELYVLINDTDLTKIPLEDRANWIKSKYPSVHIILGKDPPKQYGMDEKNIKLQTDYLKSIFENIPVTHFYSGESYGQYVARDLGVANVHIKKNIHVSATDIRNNLEKNKDFLSFDIYNKLNSNNKNK